VYHLDTEKVSRFVDQYFSSHERLCLVICGAGFDPRSYKISELLQNTLRDNLHGAFIREERPNPVEELLNRANANHDHLRSIVSEYKTIRLNIFSEDGAPVGGRSIIRELGKFDFASYSDIVVDLSALSIGVSFPLVKFLREEWALKERSRNLHLMVTVSRHIEMNIKAEASDRVAHVLGFDGQARLTASPTLARLWLPQLARGKNQVMERLRQHDWVRPDDICPILPFPSSNPRESDELAECYLDEFLGDWDIGGKDLILADESNPLDLYRTLIKVDDQRSRIFERVGGSIQILSPMGSRLLSIGALMAALDRNLPVVYVESIGYSIDESAADQFSETEPHFVHVWLEGDAYPPRQ